MEKLTLLPEMSAAEELAKYKFQLEEVCEGLISEPKPSSTLPDQHFDWKIGDSCEIKNSENNSWTPGEVQSISADRSKFNIKVKHQNIEKSILVSAVDVRKRKAATKYYGYVEGNGKKSKENREKRVQQKEKFRCKKEAEQSKKADSWLSFQSRIVKSTAPNAASFAKTHKSVYTKPEVK